jgi:hypothetical protein
LRKLAQLRLAPNVAQVEVLIFSRWWWAHSQIAANGANCRKWRKLTANGANWPQMAQIDRKWRKLAANGANWPQMAQIGCKRGANLTQTFGKNI